MPPPTTPEVYRLAGRGRTIRLGVTAAVLAALGYGTVAGHDGHFPVGPMVQYAFYVSPDGEIVSTTVEADTTAGAHVVVPLSPGGVGIKRASIEGQLTAILADPSLLRPIAVGQRRLHPRLPQYTRLYVVQNVTLLRDGGVAGHERRVLASWDVR
jgi:hypothetical protein